MLAITITKPNIINAPIYYIMWFSLSHFFPDGVRHHIRKITQGTLIANNITIVPIIYPPFYLSITNLLQAG